MKLGDLIKILSTTSIPTTYRAFEEGKSPGDNGILFHFSVLLVKILPPMF